MMSDVTLTIVQPGAELLTPKEWITGIHIPASGNPDAHIHTPDGIECSDEAIIVPGFEKLIEIAGRTCYKSEEKITDESAGKFIRSIIRRGHESVIEHLSITYRIICSRACSHQLVRHRIAAYSQESQRYCDYGKLGFQIIVPPGLTPDAHHWLEMGAKKSYSEYLGLRERGAPPEDARFLLPNCCKTEVVTTFNLRQWRHVLRERGLNKHAQWEIRGIMLGILDELYQLLPNVFGDLKE